jgi:flagellar M-ring protein FliF
MDRLKVIRKWLNELSPRQRFILAGGVVVIVGVLYGFAALMGTPDYKTLYSGSNPSDTQALAARLQEKKIPFRLSPDGSAIQVPAEHLDKARLEIASNGLPRSGRLGFEVFDKPDWMGSDFAEKVNYQRALEGELERSIQTLSEVEAARVHIVLPRESLFTDREREAKASIVLRLRRLPSHESEQAIVHLVSGAVDNLRPENVTLVDSAGRVLSSPQRRGGNAVNADLERELTAKLLATLEPVIGRDHVRASVNVEYDLASTEDNQETYDPHSAVPLTVQKSEETAGDQRPAGIPGTTSNLPTGKTQVPGGVTAVSGASQSHRTESSTFAVNRNVRHVVQPAGGIRRISAAVLLDANSAQRSPEQLQQIASLARAALDFDSKRGDSVEVQSIAFAPVATETVVPPTLPVRVVTVVQRWTNVLRYVAIALLFVVVYLLVLKPVRKQVVATMRQLGAQAAASTAAAATAAAHPLPAAGGRAELPPSQIGDPELRRQIVDKVKREPQNAGKLIQSWIRQGEVAK